MSAHGDNLVELTVAELSGQVKRLVEDSFGRVRVRGELGRVSRPASGHVYFDVKDDKAVLSGVMWKGTVQKLAMQPEQGLEVVVTGKLTTFAGQSRYQMVVEAMEPAGEGALMALLEARKKQLAAEGLFDAARKQPIPYLPETIGVITSPSGAVIRDILHRLADRFPRHVLVWPVRVQGESCAEEVAKAIAGFNALPKEVTSAGTIKRPDVLIVARGGGSLEDLWGFNEEIVARTAAQSDIPLISAVGHETDTTLIDFAADRRAPTPTAAAEMAVPVRADLMAQINDFETRLLRAETRRVEQARNHLDGLARGLPKLEDMLALPAQRLDAVAQRLGGGLQANINKQSARLANSAARLTPAALQTRLRFAAERLGALMARAGRQMQTTIDKQQAGLAALSRQLRLLSYENVLERGFALVLDETGKPLRAAAQANPGSLLDIRLAAEQRVAARVESGGAAAKAPVEKSTASKTTPKKAKKPKPSGGSSGDGGQGQLL
ncbi:MAG: exodeoxyribonuclease VII large subunit [PS1 clade bacterium]|uniref:Exodeoxyribonuclease 7 large subunit n=1 Tax=PS1 clade bacterium TaxID=2175152 RepID=A0A937L5S0_9PROT|nr:exodeoxyribonuclease VII large subunit [PS1 clade bacterium]